MKTKSMSYADLKAKQTIQSESGMNYGQIMERMRELKVEAAEALKRERPEVIQKIKAGMAAYGITTADLKRATPPVPVHKKSKSNGKVVRKRASVSKAPASAKKSATVLMMPRVVKFRNPATGETWSGRGRHVPKWIKAHEAKGGKRDDFLVQKAKAA